jgi:predicted Zn-dependent peptidase
MHTAAAQPAGVVRTVLDNGLTVLVEQRRSANTVALQLTARAGSCDDGPLPGLNLITSRLLFQGTAGYPSQADLQGAAALAGGSLTRGTAQEHSSFVCLLPAPDARLGFHLLAEIVLRPLFEPDTLQRQKLVALQELSQRRANPDTLLDDLFVQTAFAGRSVGTPVLGTRAGIEAITDEAVRANAAATFSAANLVLSVAGRIAPDEALAAAHESFGALSPGRLNVRPPQVAAPQTRERIVRGEVGAAQIQVRLGFPAPGLLDRDDRYAMLVLDAIMGASSGRLFEEVRNKRGLAYVAGSSYVGFSDAGAWFATAGVEPQSLEHALDIVHTEVARLSREPVDEQAVTDGIGLIVGEHSIQGEGNGARARRLGQQQVLGTESSDEFLRGIRRVSPLDVQRVARAHLNSNEPVLVIVGPVT